MQPSDTTYLTESELSAVQDLAMQLRAASWDVALEVVETAITDDLVPSLRALGTVKRLANLPAFIGGLAMTVVRPRPGRRRGTNPVLQRMARDHVVERELAGFSAREVVQEFLLLRRVMWRFIQRNVDSRMDARCVLKLEDLINSVLDEVIAECTVIYFERATEELSERSRRDSLTGLLNHQAFNTRLDEEMDRARRYDHELQVIYFDLDDFKLINDTYGHLDGDRALTGIAEIVMESIRESDFAGRIGGDEFVIGLVQTNDMAAQLLLDRLRGALAQAAATGGVPPGTLISAGCAGFPLEADCAHDLLVLADRRQYEDKRARKAGRSTSSWLVDVPPMPAVEGPASGFSAEPNDALEANDLLTDQLACDPVAAMPARMETDTPSIILETNPELDPERDTDPEHDMFAADIADIVEVIVASDPNDEFITDLDHDADESSVEVDEIVSEARAAIEAARRAAEQRYPGVG